MPTYVDKSQVISALKPIQDLLINNSPETNMFPHEPYPALCSSPTNANLDQNLSHTSGGQILADSGGVKLVNDDSKKNKIIIFIWFLLSSIGTFSYLKYKNILPNFNDFSSLNPNHLKSKIFNFSNPGSFNYQSKSLNKYRIAIGCDAGTKNQGERSIAIGYQGGSVQQRSKSVAIGNCAGKSSTGKSSLLIGNMAGYNNENDNVIILSACENIINSSHPNSFYVDPIRCDTIDLTKKINVSSVFYNKNTKEIVYSKNCLFGELQDSILQLRQRVRELEDFQKKLKFTILLSKNYDLFREYDCEIGDQIIQINFSNKILIPNNLNWLISKNHSSGIIFEMKLVPDKNVFQNFTIAIFNHIKQQIMKAFDFIKIEPIIEPIYQNEKIIEIYVKFSKVIDDEYPNPSKLLPFGNYVIILKKKIIKEEISIKIPKSSIKIILKDENKFEMLNTDFFQVKYETIDFDDNNIDPAVIELE